MELVADLFSGLLAFVFGSAAIGKLVRQRQQVLTADTTDSLGSLPMDCRSRGGSDRRAPDRPHAMAALQPGAAPGKGAAWGNRTPAHPARLPQARR